MITKYERCLSQLFSAEAKQSLARGVLGVTRSAASATSNAVLLSQGLLVLFVASALSAFGQEPQVDEFELPRISATEPADALSTFEIRPGFQLKLVAHEPDVVDPIAMAFDADGGMYVIEMRGYSERRDEKLGRIRYLEDRDGDGTFERSTIFKDGLKWPSGIVCYDGGIFVGANPDISYFKDTDGDGESDEERLVFTGFGPDGSRINMQALFNSFRWGPDNRIWGATASNGGAISKPDDPSFETVPIRGADFSFDPVTLDFRAENGTAQYGLSFDSQGRRFVCSNSRHALWVAYERGHFQANPYYDLPAPLVDIPQDGAAAPVYRISPDEPWRIVRTRWRVSGVVKGMIEGGGRVSGYFTSASGIHVYWGGAFGEASQDNLFVGDVGSNLVHRKIITQSEGRIQPVALRPEDEGETEFLRSHDNWFRPASFATGPDGCLYICDMYRETIEHPWSLPPGIKQHLDLNSGYDRGRIYRVEPDGFRRSAIPQLSRASDAELVALAQEAKDDWRQSTARRLLFERGQPVPAKPTPSPFPALLSREDSLMQHFPEWKGDPWLEATILNSLRDEAAIRDAWKHALVAESPRFERELAKMSGRNGNRAIIEAIVARLGQNDLSPREVSVVSAIKEGVSFARGNWASIEMLDSLSTLFARAEAVAGDSSARIDTRFAAMGLLELRSGGDHDALLKRIVNDESSPEGLVAEAAKNIGDGLFLLTHFARLSAETRGLVAARMTKSASNALRLLGALEAREITLEAIPAGAIQRLRQHKDARVVARSSKVLPEVESRSELVARYQSALGNGGDPAKGEGAFDKACISCHQTERGKGYVFGPPVATFKTAGKASILGNILDPNQEVAPQYQAFQFVLKNGEEYLGMISSEDQRNVTLALPGGAAKTFPRSEVESMKGLGRSLMPEGLEASLSVEEMRNLLAYLIQ